MRDIRQILAKLDGVFAPVTTPLDARTGELDRHGFERNVRSHAAAGLRGVVVSGSTGEAALLDEAERAELVALAREALPTDRLVIAGTGAESTRAALRLTADAAREGADAVIVVAPHYYSDAMTAAALLAHYHRIADESPVPVVLYSIPKYMHFALPAAVVEELAVHENVIGIKDSSGDLQLLSAYLEAQSDDFRVLTGNGSTFAQALDRGAGGGILAVATFAAALAMEVYESSQRGDRSAAMSAQSRLTPLGQQIVGALGVPGVKAALDHVGLVGGAPRPPLLALEAADRDRIATLLRNAERPVAA